MSGECFEGNVKREEEHMQHATKGGEKMRPSVGKRRAERERRDSCSSSMPQGLVPFGACLDYQQQKTENSHTSIQKHTLSLSLSGKTRPGRLTNTHFPESPLRPNVEHCGPTGQRGRVVAGSNP